MNFHIPRAFSRGDICVVRPQDGVLYAFRISPQRNYREWNGCFSLI